MAWRRSGRKRLAITAAILLFLTPLGLAGPLSSIPNPIGLYYVISGGYEYQPGSPFVNRFALLGSSDPRPKLIPQLDALVGKTGLDPLDPIQPLAAYRLLRLLNHQRGLNFEAAAAEIEMRYADGSARIYQIPVYDRVFAHEDRSFWRYSGLGRALAINETLPWLPVATEQTAIVLGEPTRLTMGETAAIASGPLWSTAYLGMSEWGGAIRPLPDGQGFLLLRPEGDDFGQFAARRPNDAATLWLVPSAGASARRIDGEVRRAVADPTGRFVVYTRWRDTRKPEEGYYVTVYDRQTNTRRTVGRADNPAAAIAGSAVYFLRDGIVSRATLTDGPAQEILTRADATSPPSLRTVAALAIAPAEDRIAYRCFVDLCLTDPTGQNVTRLPLDYAIPSGRDLSSWRYESFGLAWSADGQRLAVTVVGCCKSSDHQPYATPKLLILDRGGRLLQEYALGPDGSLAEPQWTPDGRFVFVNAFPRGGRRIVAIDTAAGTVADLSQPSWDAFFGITSDGATMLLWNGRGGSGRCHYCDDRGRFTKRDAG